MFPSHGLIRIARSRLSQPSSAPNCPIQRVRRSVHFISLCRIASTLLVLSPSFSTTTLSTMCAASSDPVQDDTPFASHPQPPPPPKSSTSPPFADAVVRPFTSQGSTSRTPFQLLAYSSARRRPDERPASAGGSPIDFTGDKVGPYMSASARTSYTRVDVDCMPSPVYPPLPSLPAWVTAQNATPIEGAAALPNASPPSMAIVLTPTPDLPSNNAQPFITEPPIPQTPQVSLTFLLVTGLRKTQSFEPETTVGRVKELVWNAWPARDAGPLSFPFRLRDDRPHLTDDSFFVSRLVLARSRLAGRTPACAILSPHTVSRQDTAGRRYVVACVFAHFASILLPPLAASRPSPLLNVGVLASRM